MTVRMAFRIGCVAIVALGAAVFYAHRNAAPACDSDAAQGQVYRALHDQFHLEGVFLHDFTRLSGGFFSGARDCVAEVAEIRGNVDAADLRWRHVRYRVARSDTAERPVVTVDLGGATDFVLTKEPSLWARLLLYF